MDFPIAHLFDERAAGRELERLFHPGGLACPKCSARDYYRHSRLRDGIDKQRCRACGAVFHFLSGTAFSKTPLPNSTIVLILRGLARGESTAGLARELGLDRSNLLKLRHRLQANAAANLDPAPLPDADTETDECYQNAGEKGVPHRAPKDPPRRRANKKRGPATTVTTARASSGP